MYVRHTYKVLHSVPSGKSGEIRHRANSKGTKVDSKPPGTHLGKQACQDRQLPGYSLLSWQTGSASLLGRC